VREPIENCCILAFVPLVHSYLKKNLTYLLVGLRFTRCIVTHETRLGSSRLQIWIPVSKYLERVSPDLYVLLTRAYVLDERYLIVHSYATISSRRIQSSLPIGWMEPFTHACSLESTLSSVIDLESWGFSFFLFLAMLITLPWHWLDLLWNNYLRHALGCFDTFLIKLFKWPHGGRSWMPSHLYLVLWSPSQLAFERSLVCHKFCFVFTIVHFMDISLLSMTTLCVLKVIQKSPHVGEALESLSFGWKFELWMKVR